MSYALTAFHGDYTSTFEEVLVKSEDITVHYSNLQMLLMESINAPITLHYMPKLQTSYGQSTLSFRRSILSRGINLAQNVKRLKTMIKNWKGKMFLYSI